jgi:hypothetical protein
LFAFREAGMQVSPVTMSCPSPKASAPLCLPLFIKGPLKEEEGLLLFAFGFWFGGLFGLWLDFFALGFLVWEAL